MTKKEMMEKEQDHFLTYARKLEDLKQEFILKFPMERMDKLNKSYPMEIDLLRDSFNMIHNQMLRIYGEYHNYIYGEGK